MNRLLEAFMRFFFKHLYTSIAWTYDFVAWTSSMGQWRLWQHAALIDFEPGLLLEIGHGPGHLLIDFTLANRRIIGVDASRQMTQMARRRSQAAGVDVGVTQAKAQSLPFTPSCFSGVIATFPSEYVLEGETIKSALRVLKPKGKFVLVGLKSITGRAFYDRLAAWLYRTTGQSNHPESSYGLWLNQLEKFGFNARIEIIEQPRAEVLRVVAVKT
jgi:ubiquinone/menaquinone biosynthesis C-methylase UbiE